MKKFTFMLCLVFSLLAAACPAAGPDGKGIDEKVYQWICLMQRANGLVEESEGSDFVSLYSNALASIVFTYKGDTEKAQKVFRWFNKNIKECQAKPGGFGQFRDADGYTAAPHRWMGDNAWLLIALRYYGTKTKDKQFRELADTVEKWLRALQDKDGGVWGGYQADWSMIEKNTEGNIDALNAVPCYGDFHRRLLDWLKKNRWDKENNVMKTDWSPYYYAPDLISWGYLALGDQYRSALRFAQRFMITQKSTLGAKMTGISFDLADKDCIWIEATGQMALAYKVAGMKKEADFLIKEIEKMYAPSRLNPSAGGMVYSTQRGTTFGPEKLWEGADTIPSLGTSCWYLMAKWGADPMAAGRKELDAGLKKDARD